MEPLSDPCGDRVVKDLIAPPQLPLSEDILFPPRDLTKKKGKAESRPSKTA